MGFYQYRNSQKVIEKNLLMGVLEKPYQPKYLPMVFSKKYRVEKALIYI